MSVFKLGRGGLTTNLLVLQQQQFVFFDLEGSLLELGSLQELWRFLTTFQ